MLKRTIFATLIIIAAISCKEDDPQLSQGSWAQKNDFAGPGRKVWISFDANEKGYAGLGIDDNGLNYNDFWEYNATGDSWTQKTAYSGFIPVVASIGIGGKGYIISYEGTFHQYDPASDTWTAKAAFPGANHRASVASFTAKGKGYFGMGYDTGTGLTYLDLWEYNPSTDQWKKLADYPQATANGASTFSFSILDKGYVALSPNASNVFNTIYEYDPQTNAWTKKADLPNGSLQVNFNFTNGAKGYVGAAASSSETQTWEFDPSENSWRQVATLPSSNTILAVCFTVNQKSYVVAGRGSTFTKAVWEFTP
jgi:N-acetylneuraminic acid mutarotase